jgi:signal transduction histidine kinase
VRALFADHEGNLWIGTSGNGLARLRIRQWRMFNGNAGLISTKLTALAVESSGQLWAGTEDAGLMRFDGTRFESYDAGFPLNCAMHIQSLCVDRNGALWVATWGRGLFRAAGGRQWHFGTGEGLSDDVVLAVAAERSGDGVWVGTRAGGLHRISATNIVSYTTADGLSGQPIRCVLPTADGRLIIGSEGGGLIRWDGNRLAVVPTPPALATLPVHCLAEDRAGRLWVGTAGGGVYCRSGGTWLALSSADGLTSDVIEQIMPDDAGNLWFGSDKGVFQVRASDVQAFLAGSSRSISCMLFARGAGQEEIACAVGWPGAIRTPGGELWFASSVGLLSINPSRTRVASAPPVMIERVLVDEAVTAVTELGGENHPLQLGPGTRSLDFEFTAINFTAPERTRFRYKLEGLDANWTQSDAGRRAHYGPLQPGRYRFRVIASNAGGVWSEPGASLSLVVRPPLWRAWWFITLCSVSLVAAIWMGVRYVSLRRLHAELRKSEHRRAMERERTRIAQDMHDEIGSKLTRISFLSEVARQTVTGAGEDGAPIKAIADTSRELLKALDEIVWAVNPRNDNLEHLIGYLEQYAREYFLMTPVECEINVPPRLPQVELSAEVRHNVFLAFEEALGNALKHANPAKVCVIMSVHGNAFEILVKDDGRGFEVNKSSGKTGRNGLINMAARLRAVGGTCEATSEPGSGTSVRLSCPLLDHASVAISE